MQTFFYLVLSTAWVFIVCLRIYIYFHSADTSEHNAKNIIFVKAFMSANKETFMSNCARIKSGNENSKMWNSLHEKNVCFIVLPTRV